MKWKKPIELSELDGDFVFAEDVIDPRSGAVLISKGTPSSKVKKLDKVISYLQKAGVRKIVIFEDRPPPVPPIQEIKRLVTIDIPLISSRVIHLSLMSFKDFVREVKNEHQIDLSSIAIPVKHLFQEIMNTQAIILSLLENTTNLDYLATHALNVAILSMAIAKRLGYSYKEIQTIGISSMLKDIGMLKIPPFIVMKKGPLTESEMEQIKLHPIYSLTVLKQVKKIDTNVLISAYQHHEWVSGQGYPLGLKDKDIHPLAQIIAVADVFDALTSNRTYKEKIPSYQAISKLLGEAAIHFKKEIIDAFFSFSGLYPQGSVVNLSNGSTAVVLENNDGTPLRPKVKVITNYKGEFITPYVVNLKDSDLYITSVVGDIGKRSVFY